MDQTEALRKLQRYKHLKYVKMTIQEEMADLQRLFPDIPWKECHSPKSVFAGDNKLPE